MRYLVNLVLIFGIITTVFGDSEDTNMEDTSSRIDIIWITYLGIIIIVASIVLLFIRRIDQKLE